MEMWTFGVTYLKKVTFPEFRTRYSSSPWSVYVVKYPLNHLQTNNVRTAQRFHSSVLSLELCWFTVVMYLEWKSDASFRKARPACVFTTSWKHQIKFSLIPLTEPHRRTTQWQAVSAIITHSAATLRGKLKGKSHLYFFVAQQRQKNIFLG